MRRTRALEYTYDNLTFTVTGWAEHLKIKRSAMANRISRWKKGEITADKCFGQLEKMNVGIWDSLSNESRPENLSDIPNRTIYDQKFAPGKDSVNQ